MHVLGGHGAWQISRSQSAEALVVFSLTRFAKVTGDFLGNARGPFD